jgi:hypothetical protein
MLAPTNVQVMATFHSALSTAVATAPPGADGGRAEDGIMQAVLERMRRLIGRIEECGQAALLPSTLVRFTAPCADCEDKETDRCKEQLCVLLSVRPVVIAVFSPAERIRLHNSVTAHNESRLFAGISPAALPERSLRARPSRNPGSRYILLVTRARARAGDRGDVSAGAALPHLHH